MVRMVVVVIAVCAGWIVWRRWTGGCMPTTPAPAERMSCETLALDAFLRGNGCLREGQFAEARTAFHQARALDPTLSYVVAGLAEVERQHAGGARNAAYLTRYPRAIGIGYTAAPEPALVQRWSPAVWLVNGGLHDMPIAIYTGRTT